jgi:hypothetical protein
MAGKLNNFKKGNMKNIVCLICIYLAFACNMVTNKYESKIDSAGNKLDSLGNKIEDVVNNTTDSLGYKLKKLKDSAVVKGGRLGDSVKAKGGRIKDSLKYRRRDTTRF